MPRLYADNPEHNMSWGEVDFINGVAAVAAGADTSYFTAASYAVDASKNAVTLFDTLTVAQLKTLCDYLGVSYASDVTKQTIVRAIETSFSAKYLASVTVASTAGAAIGDSDIAITGEGTYKYKTAATTAPTLLYMDYPDSTWTTITTGTDITPASGHDKITVVKIDDDGYVIGLGSDDITVKVS